MVAAKGGQAQIRSKDYAIINLSPTLLGLLEFRLRKPSFRGAPWFLGDTTLNIGGIDAGKFLGNGRHRRADLLVGMHTGDEEPQSGGAFFYHRMDNRLHVDAPLKQRVRQLHCVGRVAGDHGYDRRVVAQSCVEPRLY